MRDLLIESVDLDPLQELLDTLDWSSPQLQCTAHVPPAPQEGSSPVHATSSQSESPVALASNIATALTSDLDSFNPSGLISTQQEEQEEHIQHTDTESPKSPAIALTGSVTAGSAGSPAGTILSSQHSVSPREY